MLGSGLLRVYFVLRMPVLCRRVRSPHGRPFLEDDNEQTESKMRKLPHGVVDVFVLVRARKSERQRFQYVLPMAGHCWKTTKSKQSEMRNLPHGIVDVLVLGRERKSERQRFQ